MGDEIWKKTCMAVVRPQLEFGVDDWLGDFAATQCMRVEECVFRDLFGSEEEQGHLGAFIRRHP
jgi:hypothetical protein